MVTDLHVRRLRRLDLQGWPKGRAAVKAGIDEKTARKYRRLGKLPSEVRMEHTWRTRLDPFADVWPQVEEQLTLNPGLLAQTVFAWLQAQYPGRFADGQLRTLQRHIKQWRAVQGPAKEVFFTQVHEPGRLGASDFTHCSDLGITIGGVPFPHLIYHFVLTYSNWETGTICFAESFESLSTGLQNALWELGGVPQTHRTDSLTAAVPPGSDRPTFQRRYQGLLRHYDVRGQAINPRQAHENGDVEQSHHQFKRALDQALMLRGSRDFASRAEYAAYVRQLFAQRNLGRATRLAEELAVLRPLPPQRLEACQRVRVRVDRGSTIHVRCNTYSVASRLIGEWVEARIHADHIEVWYAQRLVERLPRLRGRGKHHINYRHVIDWLVRKPGAFADYCYRDDLFPSSRFRWAYDTLMSQHPERAAKEYVQILYLAARDSESGLEVVLERSLNGGGRLLRQSQLPLDKSWPALDLKRLPAKVLQQARLLLEGSFVQRRENVLGFGSADSGKTYLAFALGLAAGRHGWRVRFFTAAALVNRLEEAQKQYQGAASSASTTACSTPARETPWATLGGATVCSSAGIGN